VKLPVELLPLVNLRDELSADLRSSCCPLLLELLKLELIDEVLLLDTLLLDKLEDELTSSVATPRKN
jgi:hypothetical protein